MKTQQTPREKLANSITGAGREAILAQASHSPLPWMVDDETVNHGPIIIQRNGALEIAAIYGDGREQRAANAAFIVRACNNAERLADAIRESIRNEDESFIREALVQWEKDNE